LLCSATAHMSTTPCRDYVYQALRSAANDLAGGKSHKGASYSKAASSVKGIAGELVTLEEKGGKFFPNNSTVPLRSVASVIGKFIKEKMNEFAARHRGAAAVGGAAQVVAAQATLPPVRLKVLLDGVVPTTVDEVMARLMAARMPPMVCQQLREQGFGHVLCFTSELSAELLSFLPLGLRTLVVNLSQDMQHLIALPANLRLNFLFKKRVNSIDLLLAQHFSDKQEVYKVMLDLLYIETLETMAEVAPNAIVAESGILVGQAVALVWGAKLALRQKT
jgi:hypothetical protein